ncbi:unnamed protein product [Arctia plantaginis]|uniref:IMFamide n=1 Tax=Arctia plantaginis TaxID=874455 RepID=A0A8S1A9F0_ARCPL|nr:unnamed protein product [Arctia plantaginis]
MHQLRFAFDRVTTKKYIYKIKMSGVMMRFTIGLVCVVAVLLSLAEVSEANYKNAPMNGIMFGKRGPTEYDSRGKTFSALCEIATEACQTWFPSPENK